MILSMIFSGKHTSHCWEIFLIPDLTHLVRGADIKKDHHGCSKSLLPTNLLMQVISYKFINNKWLRLRSLTVIAINGHATPITKVNYMTIKPFKTVKLHFSIGVLLIHGELIGLELQWLAVVVAREAPHDVGCGRLLGWQLSGILGNTWDVMGIWKESHEIYCGYNGDLMRMELCCVIGENKAWYNEQLVPLLLLDVGLEKWQNLCHIWAMKHGWLLGSTFSGSYQRKQWCHQRGDLGR